MWGIPDVPTRAVGILILDKLKKAAGKDAKDNVRDGADHNSRRFASFLSGIDTNKSPPGRPNENDNTEKS